VNNNGEKCNKDNYNLSHHHSILLNLNMYKIQLLYQMLHKNLVIQIIYQLFHMNVINNINKISKNKAMKLNKNLHKIRNLEKILNKIIQLKS
jgi:hypothetical protein